MKSNLYAIQQNLNVFKNVCELLHKIYTKKIQLSSTIDEFSRTQSTIKCELVRLIGIFVFENETNQRALVDNGLIHLLSENLDIDVENPFLREWTILALRHILCAHDRK